MDVETLRKVKLEIEDVNQVPDEGEKQDTVDGFRKFIKKQIRKITSNFNKDDKDAFGTSAGKAGSKSSGAKAQGDEDSADIYDFTYPERGLAIIINNENFYLTKDFGDRPGSSYDAVSLYQTFKNLGFRVWVKEDLTAWQMIEVLKSGKDDYDHGRADCFVCAILSHGNETLLNSENARLGSRVRKDLLFGVDGKAIKTKDVIEIFSDNACLGLRGKPRLFFLQACRGERLDDGTFISVVNEAGIQETFINEGHDGADQGKVYHPECQNLPSYPADSSDIQNLHIDNTDALSESSKRGNNIRNLPYRDKLRRYSFPLRDIPVSPAPLYKDSLVMYATPPGFYAWRRRTGAWFIQTLCNVLDSPGIDQKSLLNALVQVVGKVAIDYMSDNPLRPDMHEKKETPVIESMLIKDVFFTKKV